MRRCRDAEVQRCRGAGTVVEVWRSRFRGDSGSEVQVQWCRCRCRCSGGAEAEAEAEADNFMCDKNS